MFCGNCFGKSVLNKKETSSLGIGLGEFRLLLSGTSGKSEFFGCFWDLQFVMVLLCYICNLFTFSETFFLHLTRGHKLKTEPHIYMKCG